MTFLKNIIIDESIKKITPNFSIGAILMEVTVEENKQLQEKIDEIESEIRAKYNIKDIIHLENIKDGRDAYKAYGKDPSRYRLAVESLYRRIVKNNKLYRINNVVDSGNLLSILTKNSTAVLDYEKIVGDIRIRLGKLDDDYCGIGRGKLNISNIPVYEDKIGPFGSTTSDTERTMITNVTSKILLFIISFTGKEKLNMHIENAITLYEKYCNAKILEKRIII